MPERPIQIDPELLRDTLLSIYDDYRDALLNRKYNGFRVDQFTRYNKVFEILIAVGASGSGIAGLALWKHEYGQLIWGLISSVSIILAVVKPILNISSKVDEYSSLYAEYSFLYGKFKLLVGSISAERAYILENGTLSPATAEAVQEVRSRAIELGPKGDHNPDIVLATRLQQDVNRDIPPSSLWLPNYGQGQ